MTMLKINVDSSGLAATQAKLRGLADGKINVAVKAALNDAGYLGSRKTAEAVAAVFDRPTPWVKGSVRYTKATTQKLQVQIDFDHWGNKQLVTVAMVLDAQIHSGKRKLKRHEVALQRAGILPSGWAIVPGKAADMDQYGNMKAGEIVQIISWFRGFGEQGYKSNMTDATKDKRRKGTRTKRGFEYFYVPPGGLRTFVRANGKTGTHKMQPGIYRRVETGFGSAIKPVMIFVRIPSYRRRLDFYRIAQEAAVKEFDRAFPKYLNQLLKERGL